MQFEIDIRRWIETAPTFESKYTGEGPMDRLMLMAKTAVADTISHGGTFVLVVSSTTVTMIQRPDAEPIEAADGADGATP